MVFLLAVLSCALVPALYAQTDVSMGTVQGRLFLVGPDGPVQIDGAAVMLAGPVERKAETDAGGHYAFEALPPGTYQIEAVSSGLRAQQTITVEAHKVTDLDLQLKPSEITSTVTVTATPTDGNAAASETISEQTLRDAPNVSERFESALPLVPGVVRGPDGHINLKGARSTQSGALVNSANVTDPVTGSPALNLPIDVVASVQVISNPYDPQYGKFTGAVSTVSTKTSDYEKFHFSIQNFLPRLRDRDGTIMGIGAATPRATITGPVLKDRIAITQSFEYRYVRTPVNSLPPAQRDTKLESFDSYTQIDFTLSPKQTATASISLYPQKLDYLGLNTFTPQRSTPDFHQRGYQLNVQHRYLIGKEGVLSSQFSYKRFDADVTAQSNDPYQLMDETTQGGFFNRQARRTSRLSWEENYSFAPWQFAGSHHFTVGLSYEHSAYDGHQTFLPVQIDGVSNAPVELISFTSPTSFSINQNETAWFAGDQWAIIPRLTLSLGVRFDSNT